MESKPHKGIISLFIGSDGRIIAHAADFCADRPGGYTVQEAQSARAKQSMYHEVMRAMCNTDLAGCISTHMADQILADMCKKYGYRIEEIIIDKLATDGAK